MTMLAHILPCPTEGLILATVLLLASNPRLVLHLVTSWLKDRS